MLNRFKTSRVFTTIVYLLSSEFHKKKSWFYFKYIKVMFIKCNQERIIFYSTLLLYKSNNWSYNSKRNHYSSLNILKVSLMSSDETWPIFYNYLNKILTVLWITKPKSEYGCHPHYSFVRCFVKLFVHWIIKYNCS